MQAYCRILIVLVVAALLGGASRCGAQEEKRPKYVGGRGEQTIDWMPPAAGTGVAARITCRAKYGVFGGPTLTVVAKAEKGDVAYYQGRAYRREEVGEKVWRQLKFGIVNLEADIFQGQHKVTTVRYNNVIEFDVAALMELAEVFPGISAEQTEQLFRQGFVVTNFRVVDVSPVGFGALEALRKKELQQEQFQQKVREADGLLSSRAYEEALAAYREAARLNREDAYVQGRIVEVKENLKRIEEEKRAAQAAADSSVGSRYASSGSAEVDSAEPGSASKPSAPFNDLAKATNDRFSAPPPAATVADTNSPTKVEAAESSANSTQVTAASVLLEQSNQAAQKNLEEAQQSLNNLGQALAYGMQSGVDLKGVGFGFIVVGDAIGFSIGGVNKSIAVDFSIATNSFTASDSVSNGEVFEEFGYGHLTFGKPVFKTEKIMPYAGLSFTLGTEYRKVNQFDKDRVRDFESVGIPLGITGRLGGFFIYKAGYDVITERPQGMLGLQF